MQESGLKGTLIAELGKMADAHDVCLEQCCMLNPF